MPAYVTFELNHLPYALSAMAVREMFPLPELVPVAEAPGDVIGLLNLRGRILPVMHLAKRLGQELPPCQVDDRVIVLDWQGLQLGMVVHSVRDAIELDPAAITSEPDYGRNSNIHTAFVGGVVPIDDALVVVLNPDTLVRVPTDVAALAADDSSDELFAAVPTSFYDLYFPTATAAERELLRDRALVLQEAVRDNLGEDDGRLVATFSLGGEFFGIEVDRVREILRLPEFTPVPCCPSHILGNANLRGEILTLVDVRTALNLPASDRNELTQAIVVEVGEIVAGIATGEVFDVLPLSTELQEMPTAGQAHLRGIAAHGEIAVGILDLPALLTRGNLIVNQAVA
ncbi:MAG: chemotaxis protein CheW [Cyanobacteria bacterium J06641_5]